jgi:hypothetical protein
MRNDNGSVPKLDPPDIADSSHQVSATKGRVLALVADELGSTMSFNIE